MRGVLGQIRRIRFGGLVVAVLVSLASVGCGAARSGDDLIRAADNLIESGDDAIRVGRVPRSAVDDAIRTLRGSPTSQTFRSRLADIADATDQDAYPFLHDVACAILDYHLENGGSPTVEDVAAYMAQEAVARGLGETLAQRAADVVSLVQDVQTLDDAALVAFVIVECM